MIICPLFIAESSDAAFYDSPRFVTHIDDGAINALTKWYSEAFPPSGNKDVAILDVCSSWISHFPAGYTAGKISGLGMNEEELKRNKVLTDYTVRDLNVDPTLPYPDATFDVITNTVSVDYLTKPIEVFKEMHRYDRPRTCIDLDWCGGKQPKNVFRPSLSHQPPVPPSWAHVGGSTLAGAPRF